MTLHKNVRNPHRMNRRALLKTLGTTTLLAPFARYSSARAQPAEIDNLFIVTYPDGLTGPWQPTGRGSTFTFSPMLKPLEPYRDQLLIIDGLQGGTSNLVLAHSEGTVSLWTGSKNFASLFSYATHPSIDQVVADHIGGQSVYKSLHAGVQSNRISFINTPYVHYSGPEQPVPAEDDPNVLYRLLANVIGGGDKPDAELERMRLEQRSVLDYVTGELHAVKAKIAAEDRPKLEQHADRIRGLERTLDTGGIGAGCRPPTDPRLTKEAAFADSNFEVTARVQCDLLALALQCGLTKVVTLQYSNTDCQLIIDRLNTSRSLHGAAHDQGSTEAERIEWSQFCVDTFSYVLERLANTPMENGLTLLDKTLVVIGSEMAISAHTNHPIPFFVAGGQSGYFKKNAFIQIPGGFFEGHDRHTKLLTSIGQSFGLPIQNFGEFTDPRSLGPLTEARA